VLEQILESKRGELDRSRRERPQAALQGGLSRSARDFEGALRRGRTGFILECKRRSPSEGELRRDYDPPSIARTYARFADAISVVTDVPFFGGSLDDLRRVSATVDLPVLRKDFILDPYQVLEARAHGADAVLLMLSALDDPAWRECAAAARDCAMGVLTEVHDASELHRALALDAAVIGINARDLRTLHVDLGVIERLAPLVPSDRMLVAESGIRTHADVVGLGGTVDAFLVGSTLMRESEIERAVPRLVFGEVKVCGLTRPEDARAAWEAGASWGGLVLVEDSPRHVDMPRAAAVRQAAPLRWAGVFVNEAPERVADFARTLRLDAVQLHGDEDASLISETRRRLPEGCEVWKAIRVRDAAPRLAETGADRLVLDAWSEDARGGTGRRFDWRFVAEHPDRERIVLAGGLDPENVTLAERAGARMLDVSSGVEDAPGRKNPTKIEALFAALRGGGRSSSMSVP